MNTSRSLRVVLGALATGAVAGFVGACASSDKPQTTGSADWSDRYKEHPESTKPSVPATGPSSGPWVYGKARSQPAPAPAQPAPAKAVAAKPEPKPAPAARDNRYCCDSVPAGYHGAYMAYPTGDMGTSALLVHQVVPERVRAGQAYDYEIHVKNLSANPLQNVVVTGENFSNLAVNSASPSPARTVPTPQWAFPDLKPGETRVIRVNGTARDVGVASNCVTVAYANLLCIGTNVVQPALTVAKTITPEALICDNVTMKFEVKNTGTGVAQNVRIRDTLPAGLTTADGKTSIDIDAGNLEAGQSKAFTVLGKASKTGKYDNKATAVAEGGLSAESTVVSTVIRQPVLEIACKSPERVFLGRDVLYEFTIKNTGDAPCTDTIVRATLPAGVQNARASDAGTVSGTGASWSIGSIAPGASKTLTLGFRPMTAAGTSFKVGASVVCHCATEARTECGTNVFGLPDIATVVTDDDGVVEVGADHTYRVEVNNQGQINLTNARMVVTLPEGMIFVSSAAGKLIAGNKVEFNFGTVPPGEHRDATFVVRSTKSGELVVIGETTCAEIRTPIRDDELTVFVDR